MQKRATYTAILTNYNHSQYLPDTIGTLVGQSVPFDEILLVDDCSKDNSVEIMQRFAAQHPNIRVVVNPKNLGVTGAFNHALTLATGDFIFHAASDDWYSGAIVEHAERALAENPEAALIAGNARVRFEDSGREDALILPFLQEYRAYDRSDLEALAKRGKCGFYGANLMRRSVLVEMGGLEPALAWNSDWFLYLAIGLKYPFVVMPHEVVCIRASEAQYSSRMQQWKYQRPVIEAFMAILREKHADLYPFFRRHALLPTYDFQALALFLRAPYREYVTPLLLWRLTIYKPIRFVARKLVPRRFFAVLRRLARL